MVITLVDWFSRKKRLMCYAARTGRSLALQPARQGCCLRGQEYVACYCLAPGLGPCRQLPDYCPIGRSGAWRVGSARRHPTAPSFYGCDDLIDSNRCPCSRGDPSRALFAESVSPESPRSPALVATDLASQAIHLC